MRIRSPFVFYGVPVCICVKLNARARVYCEFQAHTNGGLAGNVFYQKVVYEGGVEIYMGVGAFTVSE
jgi:hypothetical protein